MALGLDKVVQMKLITAVGPDHKAVKGQKEKEAPKKKKVQHRKLARLRYYRLLDSPLEGRERSMN